MKRWTVERVVTWSLLALASLFLIEVRYFVTSGAWVIHGGEGAFREWAQPANLNVDVTLHALGMLAWVAVVVYQLRSRGRGRHKVVGRFALVLIPLALALSLRPAFTSSLPSIHKLFGITMLDATLMLNALGILIEMFAGTYKARRGDIAGHRQHMLLASVFSVAPAAYRLLVLVGMGLFGLRGAAPSESMRAETVLIHEGAQVVAIVLALICVFTSRFGAHLKVLRTPHKHDRVERALAGFVTVVASAALLLYGLWLVDLGFIVATGEVPKPIQDGQGPANILYLLGMRG